MDLTKITGKVSGIEQQQVVTGAQSSKGTGMTAVHSHNEINFRIDNKPVTLKLKTQVHINDGEEVSVVGRDKKGVFEGYAIRNNETGVDYSYGSTWMLIVGGAFLFGSLMVLIESGFGVMGFIGAAVLGTLGWFGFMKWGLIFKNSANMLQ